MPNLNMPEGLDYQQRRQWLRDTGAALAAESGQPSGQVDFVGADGKKKWFMGWPNPNPTSIDDQHPPPRRRTATTAAPPATMSAATTGGTTEAARGAHSTAELMGASGFSPSGGAGPQL